MQQYDIIIIGSGIGGLVCGNILSLEGYRVCVLEKNKQIGGCLQTYVRDKVIFDSGVHYIGGLDKGQNLYQIFKYLGLMGKLKLEKMDPDAFDKITIDTDEKEYSLAQGYENFIAGLSADFPGETKAIKNYCDTIQSICKKFPLYNLRSGGKYSEKQDVLETDTRNFIESITRNKKLQAVLGGNNILYAGQPEKTPFYIHALILNSYIESSWKCVNGGSQIAKILAQNIRKNGGAVLCNQKANRIVEEMGRVNFVETHDGTKFYAKQFISNMHPAKTMEILQTPLIKPAYRKRLRTLENSISCFSLNIVLKKNTFRYCKHNYYWHKEGALWNIQNYDQDNWPLAYALFFAPSSKTKQYADAITIMTYMKYDEMKRWEESFNTVSSESQRGEDYENFKKQKAEILMSAAQQKFPELKNAVKSYYVATPLSYRDYLGSEDGSLYGIVKDYKDPIKTLIAPHTKLPNFFLTGQNLNLHGILGASITALATCTALLGNENIIEKIKNA
ncbi:MAG TPA: NAD(P)-binding protein [Puia sp.]|jgi:all-trans-retinol 13,14-reductase|nr:NAD(P)-binding protein [Puia sp.]